MNSTTTIWLVEKPMAKGSIAAIVMGNFPVRLVASSQRLIQLLRPKAHTSPTLILFNCDHFDDVNEDQLSSLVESPNSYLLVSRQKKIGSTNALQWSSEFALVAEINQRLLSVNDGNSYQKKYKDIMYDTSAQELVTLEGSRYLAKKEAKIFGLFLKQPGQCVSREMLASHVWNDTKVGPRTIDCYVSKLRKHLVGTELEIKSSYGGGYVLI